MVTLLLTNHATVDARDNFGHTPRLLALLSASSEALIRHSSVAVLMLIAVSLPCR